MIYLVLRAKLELDHDVSSGVFLGQSNSPALASTNVKISFVDEDFRLVTTIDLDAGITWLSCNATGDLLAVGSKGCVYLISCIDFEFKKIGDGLGYGDNELIVCFEQNRSIIWIANFEPTEVFTLSVLSIGGELLGSAEVEIGCPNAVIAALCIQHDIYELACWRQSADYVFRSA